MTIKVYRTTDKTESDFGRQLDDARVFLRRITQDNNPMLFIAFKTAKSRFTLLVESESFADIAQTMMKADADAAIKAFGAALQHGITTPPSSRPNA